MNKFIVFNVLMVFLMGSILGGAEATEAKKWKTGDVCRILPKGTTFNPCEEVGSSCSSTGAKVALCIQQKAGGPKSCAAKQCDEGYALWRTERPEGSGKYESQGVCKKKDWLVNFCRSKCVGSCSCEPNYVHNPNRKKEDKNYYDPEDVLNAVEDCKVVCNEETKCKIQIERQIWCSDGRLFDGSNLIEEYTWEELQEKGLISNAEDEDAKKCAELNLNLNKETEEKIMEYCKPRIVGDGNNSRESAEEGNVSSIIGSLEMFFGNEDKSVWKNAEGKFNGVRLASDLTAGVVLGTVGGVVSGVVIKKKQLENGFEDLHCTVGGQTVADWGDEFRVGLKK